MNKRKIWERCLVLLIPAGLLVTIGCSENRPQQLCADIAALQESAEAHEAITPADRIDQQWWSDRHLNILRELEQRGEQIELIFVGDSITQGWEKQGSQIWREYYADREALNLGFSGDRTQHVLWRLEHGEVEGISPEAAVVMIGTNNSNRQDHTAEEIADGIKAVVCKLQEKLPETQILLLAIFPRGEHPDEQREKNARASELASELADGESVFYLDIGDEFLAEDGTLSQDIMFDYLHLTPAGYRIWAEAMEPKLSQLME